MSQFSVMVRTARLASRRVSQATSVSLRSMTSVTTVRCVSHSKMASQECDPKWRSDAEDRIKEVPVIEVEGRLAICDGGSGALGHPLEYMQLDTVNPGPVTCKYCGLRYKMKQRKNRFGKTMKFEA